MTDIPVKCWIWTAVTSLFYRGTDFGYISNWLWESSLESRFATFFNFLPISHFFRGRLKHGRHFTFKSILNDVAITLVTPKVSGTIVSEAAPFAVHGIWLQVSHQRFFKIFQAASHLPLGPISFLLVPLPSTPIISIAWRWLKKTGSEQSNWLYLVWLRIEFENLFGLIVMATANRSMIKMVVFEIEFLTFSRTT